MKQLRVYLIAWNYEKFIHETINWYNKVDCNITVYDNMSTDRTVEICKDLGCEVISFNTGGKMDEKTLMNIRELCWLNPAHEEPWVVVCDEDEWVDVSENIFEADWNVNKCVGYEMFGQDGDTQEQLTYGVESAGYCKMALFNKTQIERMNFGAGSHQANPVAKEGFQVKFNPNPVALYHTKWRGWETGLNRQQTIAPRRSDGDKQRGWNFHYSLGEDIHRDYYTNGFNNRKQIR